MQLELIEFTMIRESYESPIHRVMGVPSSSRLEKIKGFQTETPGLYVAKNIHNDGQWLVCCPALKGVVARHANDEGAMYVAKRLGELGCDFTDENMQITDDLKEAANDLIRECNATMG